MQNNSKAIQNSEWKYIYNYNNKNEELYNIKSDPKELENHTDKEPLLSSKLKDQLFNWASKAKQYPTIKQDLALSKNEIEMLEALGYITTQINPGNDVNNIIADEKKVDQN